MRFRGFTLIEVLVALAILAVALAAATRAVAMMTQSSHELKLRVLAGWVAQNRLAEHTARRHWPEPGVQSGNADQAGMPLRWQETVSTTPNRAFRRIEIKVTTEERQEHALAQLVGYLADPDAK